MIINKENLCKCGIYCIKNQTNNKMYIGKSKNIYNRIKQHVYCLNHNSQDENRHLKAAWLKYGSDNFICEIIEELALDEQLLAERELYWIQHYNTIDRNFGYNLRLDSSTKMIAHDETRLLLSQNNSGENNPNYGNYWSDEQKQKMSDIQKTRYKLGIAKYNPENTQKGIKIRNEHWMENPELKQKMCEKVKEKNTKYKIYQYDKNTKCLIKIWDYIADIIKENPTYKRHNIYAVCSGEKKSMYGYIWKKVLIDDIVQSNLKELE